MEEASVFTRVSPAQKNRIILALKRRGHVVGFMGDGINDAPSLHAADIGISVLTATDVARESRRHHPRRDRACAFCTAAFWKAGARPAT